MDRADADEVVGWLDRDLVDVERIDDPTAEFNIGIEVSGLVVHVVRRVSDGPLHVGQRIEFGDGVRSGIRELSDPARDELVARIREALMGEPLIYAFQDEHDQNVAFRDVTTILVERRLYGQSSHQELMDAVITVWKALRYLDDLPRLVGILDS